MEAVLYAAGHDDYGRFLIELVHADYARFEASEFGRAPFGPEQFFDHTLPSLLFSTGPFPLHQELISQVRSTAKDKEYPNADKCRWDHPTTHSQLPAHF